MQEKITFDIFIRKAAIVLLVVLVLLTMNYLSGVLLPFFVACLVAYMLHPAVEFNRRLLRCKGDALPAIVTLVEVVAALVAFCWVVLP